jgi:hypothetical protein
MLQRYPDVRNVRHREIRLAAAWPMVSVGQRRPKPGCGAIIRIAPITADWVMRERRKRDRRFSTSAEQALSRIRTLLQGLKYARGYKHRILGLHPRGLRSTAASDGGEEAEAKARRAPDLRTRHGSGGVQPRPALSSPGSGSSVYSAVDIKGASCNRWPCCICPRAPGRQ